MYKKFFGLKANPFNVNPDPRFLFMSPHAQEALAALSYGIQSRKGFVLLTGEVGTGKTTLINRMLGWLRQQNVSTAFIFNSSLNAPQLLDFMMVELGLDCAGMEKSRLLLRLNTWLLERYRAGSTAVVVIDEAQNLSNEVLEEVRLLTNLETTSAKLLQVVLSGQPELETKLKHPQLRQLSQRISFRCKTHPLTETETESYIRWRLHLAGAVGDPIFGKDAANIVYRFSGGIPRVINLICEHSLINAFADQETKIQVSTVERVVSELGLGLERAESALEQRAVVQLGAPDFLRKVPVREGIGSKAVAQKGHS